MDKQNNFMGVLMLEKLKLMIPTLVLFNKSSTTHLDICRTRFLENEMILARNNVAMIP